jgi:hypothetical protein
MRHAKDNSNLLNKKEYFDGYPRKKGMLYDLKKSVQSKEKKEVVEEEVFVEIVEVR